VEARLLDLIYGAVSDPRRWPDVLVGVADHMGALGGMLAHCPAPGSGKAATQILGRLPEEPSAIFREHYVWNPWTVAVAKAPFGKAVSANSLLEPGYIEKTDFYADVLAPWGHADIIDISHKTLAIDGGIGGFGFCVSARDAGQTDELIRRLDVVGPHLCRAFDASLLIGGGQTGTQRHLSIALDLMPNAALLLDAQGRVTQANGAAEELLRQSDGIAFDRKGGLQLSSALSGERRALASALKQALDVADGGFGTALSDPVRVTRLSGAAPLLVLAVPLPRPSFRFWELVEPARALVIILDPSAKSRATAASMRSAYGLTPAEARVALLLASGVSGQQMPALLGVTYDTVKTHLRRCFDKTGVHSQAQLMRLLTMFPAASDIDRREQ
jgi:DNA-binding CsgD family transcriptional regulator